MLDYNSTTYVKVYIIPSKWLELASLLELPLLGSYITVTTLVFLSMLNYNLWNGIVLSCTISRGRLAYKKI